MLKTLKDIPISLEYEKHFSFLMAIPMNLEAINIKDIPTIIIKANTMMSWVLDFWLRDAMSPDVQSTLQQALDDVGLNDFLKHSRAKQSDLLVEELQSLSDELLAYYQKTPLTGNCKTEIKCVLFYFLQLADTINDSVSKDIIQVFDETVAYLEKLTCKPKHHNMQDAIDKCVFALQMALANVFTDKQGCVVEAIYSLQVFSGYLDEHLSKPHPCQPLIKDKITALKSFIQVTVPQQTESFGFMQPLYQAASASVATVIEVGEVPVQTIKSLVSKRRMV